MIQRIYSGIVLFCILIFISIYSSRYHEYFFREYTNQDVSKIVSGEGVLFSSGRLWSLPDKGIRKKVIGYIEQAQRRIWVEIYTWTDAAQLLDPIIAAHHRNIDVRVILEGNVFSTPEINIPIFKKLQDAGVPVVFADNDRYRFTHAKFWIIDDTYFVSTGNWTNSFFSKNREYVYQDDDENTRKFLEEVFLNDFSHLGYLFSEKIPPYILLSPLGAREKLLNIIRNTREKLVLYIQTLDDPEILGILDNLVRSKREVYICTALNETNLSNIKEYPNLSWRTIKKPYIHAKVMLIDDERIMIGSHNFTKNSIDNNREISMLLGGRPDFIDRISKDMRNDGCF